MTLRYAHLAPAMMDRLLTGKVSTDTKLTQVEAKGPENEVVYVGELLKTQ
jgi:hypothetical protein